VAGGWRKLGSEELHNLYASPNIVMVIRPRTIRWEGHVVRMREIRNEYKLLVENLKGKDNSVDLRVDGNIVLECVLGKYGGNCGLDASGLG